MRLINTLLALVHRNGWAERAGEAYYYSNFLGD